MWREWRDGGITLFFLSHQKVTFYKITGDNVSLVCAGNEIVSAKRDLTHYFQDYSPGCQV